MSIRAWLIIGDGMASYGLPSNMEAALLVTSTTSRGPHNRLPPANDHQPGEWLIWHIGGIPYTLVCWEIQ